MTNLFDYLNWRGDIPFSQLKFNKLDAAILAHLAYAAFDGLVSENFNQAKTIAQFAKDFNAASDHSLRVKNQFLKNKKTDDITEQLAATKRFSQVKIMGFRNIYDAKKAEQFAAVTFKINKDVVVAFRGTDDTLAGWHEDFNIGWMDCVPAEIDAEEYVKELSKKVRGKLIFTGHSKGGHLAVAVAAKAPFLIQRRIKQVYNFDGPGFAKEFFSSRQYKRIEQRTQWIYPAPSLVGMIFYHPDKYEVIKTDGIGVINQHNIITWNMLGGDFVHQDDFEIASKFFHKAFNEWFESISQEQREEFVTALFDVIEASGAKSLSDLEKNFVVGSTKMLAKLNSMEKDTKVEIKKILKILRDAVKKTAKASKEKNAKK